MRPLTLVLPYYLNADMLALQLQRLGEYPDDLRAGLEVIVVDDGSPEPCVIDRDAVPAGVCLRLYRVDVDVRWNWIAARNIGHHHASSDWVLFTDIDHLVPEATMRWARSGKIKGKYIYRFGRVNYPKGDAYKPHPNSWMMTREMFDKVGGYDERFSGYYGTDGMFRDRCEQNAKVKMRTEVLERVDRDVVADASTVTYGRKEPQDREAVPRIRREIQASGETTPHRLTFPYHPVATYGC